MTKNKKLFFAIGALLVISFFNFIPVVQAQDENQIGIKISPAIVDELVKPGDVFNKELKITNVSNREVVMYAGLKDFKAADEYGKANLITPGTESGNFISSWINISGEPIVFGPNETKFIPFSISIPKDVGCSYHGAIVFGTQAPKTRPGEAEKGAAIGISQQATCLIILQVEGACDERADIREFKTDRGVYSAPFNVKFSTKIENLGNVDVRPIGIIEIKNGFGKKVSTLMVNEAGHNVLTDSSRIFENSWRDVFGFGKYQASIALSYGTSPERGGEGRKTITMTREFWILPLKIILSFFISLIITIGLFILFLKMYKKKAIKEAMEKIGSSRSASSRVSNSPIKNYFSTFFILLGIAAVIMVFLYFILF